MCDSYWDSDTDTIVAAPTPTSAEDDRGRSAPAVVVLLPLVPARADKEQCMFPTACKWPTCSC